MTIFARKVDTGEVVWVYQMTPFDQWDYDGINENMLEDLNVDGKTRKVLIHFDRNGFAYVLDRDGRHAAACQQVRDDELGREGRHEDRSAGQGQGAFTVRAAWQYPGVPVGDGWQGPAAVRDRSERARHVVLPDQQLVHGR